MAKIDKLKEKINLLKAIFISNLIAVFSLVAYLYKQTLKDNYLVLIALFVMLFINALLYVRINKMINELEDL